SNSARGSPPRKASKTRLIPSSAFKRREREAVALELRVVELGELAMARPNDCLTGGVDLVRDRHAFGVIDPRNRLCERERDALEGVVVVVPDDHPPGIAGARTGPGACAFLR